MDKPTKKKRIKRQDGNKTVQPRSLLELCCIDVAGWIQQEQLALLPEDLYEHLQRQMPAKRQKELFSHVKSWYPNGVLAQVEHTYEGDKRVSRTSWNEDGGPTTIQVWYKQIRDGVWRYYYNNTELAEIECWLMGMKHGKCEWWWGTERPAWIKHWKHGKPHGKWKSWGMEGRLIMVKNWKNGKKHGKWKKYSMIDGRLLSVQNWSDGEKHGDWITWDGPKRLSRIENWVHGQLETSIDY